MRLQIYSDIEEMPIFNWYKITTGDYSYMLVKKKKIDEKETEYLKKKFTQLYDQYILMFGFNEQFLEVLRKKKEICMLMIRKAETKDKSINTLIRLAQEELQHLEGDTPSATSNFYEIKAHVEKKVGFQIDIRRTSVVEYKSLLNTAAQ